MSAIVEPKVAPAVCGLDPLDGHVFVELKKHFQNLVCIWCFVVGSRLLLHRNRAQAHFYVIIQYVGRSVYLSRCVVAEPGPDSSATRGRRSWGDRTAHCEMRDPRACLGG